MKKIKKKIRKNNYIKKEKKPLERHKRVLENIGKGMTLGKAIKDAGYSQNYADNPQIIRNTKSFQLQLQEVLPNSSLLKRHRQLLEKEEIVLDSKGKKVKIIKTGQPHSDVKQALDMGYKLFGSYEPEEMNLKFKGYSKDQLIDSIMSKIAKKK